MNTVPYEAVDKIRSFKTEMQEILDKDKEKFIENVESIKESVNRTNDKIRDIKQTYIEFHSKTTSKLLSHIKEIEEETLKNLQEARTKKWS